MILIVLRVSFSTKLVYLNHGKASIYGDHTNRADFIIKRLVQKSNKVYVKKPPG